jgi:hypothetical protein
MIGVSIRGDTEPKNSYTKIANSAKNLALPGLFAAFATFVQNSEARQEQAKKTVSQIE